MPTMTMSRPSEIGTLPRRARSHPWRWFANGAAILLVALLVFAAVTTRGFEWGVVGRYLFERRILLGVALSISVTIVTMVLSIVFGVGVALVRMSGFRLLSGLAAAYVWVFRSIPMLVLLLVFYNLAALFPRLSLGVPGVFEVFDLDTNTAITPLSAAIIALTLHQTAYVAELVRSGLMAVPQGQREAAGALGFRPAQSFMRIVLPQAMRIIVPPLGNEVISLLKATSLVSVIALTDLLYSVQLIYAKTYQTIPLLIVASIWYMVIVGVMSLGQQQLEKRLGRRIAGKSVAAPVGGDA